MSQLNPSPDLSRDILRKVESGDLAGVVQTLAVIDAEADLPHVCNREMMAALDTARSLVLIQRAGILRELRTHETRRLYCSPSRQTSATWQLDA